MIENNGFKNCVKCKTSKSVEFFYKLTPLRKNDDGYDYYCKECRNALAKNNYHNNKVRCSICDKPNYAKSLCRSHYLQERRNNK